MSSNLSYIPLVKNQGTNKVALIAGVLMIVIVIVTQRESIAFLVKSPEPSENPPPPQTQTPSTPIVHTNNTHLSKKLTPPP